MNKPVILAVDDDAQVLAALRRDLRTRYRESYVVISATSGEEAMATIHELKARGDALAMVISDQRMPGLQALVDDAIEDKLDDRPDSAPTPPDPYIVPS